MSFEQIVDTGSWFEAGREDFLGGDFPTVFDFVGESDRATIGESLLNKNDELLSLAALASVAFGVRGRTDFILPFIAHAAWWASGHQGVDAIYSVMGGQQTARGQYQTAALPALKDIVDFFDKSVTFSKRWQKSFWYAVGFILTYFKFL